MTKKEIMAEEIFDKILVEWKDYKKDEDDPIQAIRIICQTTSGTQGVQDLRHLKTLCEKHMPLYTGPEAALRREVYCLVIRKLNSILE